MCGESGFMVNGLGVDVFLGYYGGSFSIGNKRYGECEAKRDEPNCTRKAMIGHLEKYDSHDLAEIIVRMVDNANEG